MNDPCEGKYDIVPRLRDYINRDDNDIAEAAAYIERLRKERDEARQVMAGTDHRMSRLLSEISCRIEHGAESNGHLEAIWNLWLEGRL